MPARQGADAVYPNLLMLFRVVVASLVAGAVLEQFGDSVEQLIHKFGLSTEMLEDYARRGFAWA
jgi:hypothetical protein